MEHEAEDSVRTKMEALRTACEREISVQQQKVESFASSFRKTLESVTDRARQNAQNQAKLGELKAKLREAEDDLVKALAVKTRKEAKRMSIMDSIAAAKSRREELRITLQDQKAKRDEYAAIISQQSAEKDRQGSESKSEIQEAISWYNGVLDFHIEGGHGVKFRFKKINVRNPSEEYSFTIRHANDIYTLLDCNPPLHDTKELVHELNRTNGLFKFVRIMRQKFQEAATQGFLAESIALQQDSLTNSVSAPGLSMSTDRSEPLTKIDEHQVQHEEVEKKSKKAYSGKGPIAAILSPQSASSYRRSPRLKVKK